MAQNYDRIRPETPDPTSPVERPLRPLVVDVVIKGAKDEDRALNLIRTRKDHEYDEYVAQSDVSKLHASKRFKKIRGPYTKAVEGGVIVTYDVVEATEIGYIRFLGNRGFYDKTLLKKTGLKVKDPLDRFDVEEGRRKIEEHYHEKGYPRASVGILEGNKPDDQGVVYVVNEGFHQRIAAVQFEGNTFSTEGTLRTKIDSKPGYFWYLFRGKFDRAKLDADREKLDKHYKQYGFFDAKIGRELIFDESGQWVTIKFIINEGPRFKVRSVALKGIEKFHTEPILESFKLKSDRAFDQGELEYDKQLLTDLYGTQGHVFADIRANIIYSEEPGEVEIVYTVKEGQPIRVGEINVHIAGEMPHTMRNVVLNRLSLRPGELIDTRELRNSERRLLASQLFEHEQTQPAGDPPRIVIRPPELADDNARDRPKQGRGRRYRGQSPDLDK